MTISRVEQKVLERIFKHTVKQGFDHKTNIIEIYRLLWDAAHNEFTEDNLPTLDAFMTECFEEGKKHGLV